MTCFPGWTFEYIDEHMTLPRYEAIVRYQRKHPPLHVLVASFLGVKDPE